MYVCIYIYIYTHRYFFILKAGTTAGAAASGGSTGGRKLLWCNHPNDAMPDGSISVDSVGSVRLVRHG